MLRRFFWPIVAVGLLALSQFGLPFAIGALGSSGLTFPDPVIDQAVYDPANALDPQTEALLESRIDAIENRTGAEVVIYTRMAPIRGERRQPGRCAAPDGRVGHRARGASMTAS